jgi:hypothetical protein
MVFRNAHQRSPDIRPGPQDVYGNSGYRLQLPIKADDPPKILYDRSPDSEREAGDGEMLRPGPGDRDGLAAHYLRYIPM